MTTRVIDISFELEMNDDHPNVKRFLDLPAQAQRELLNATISSSLIECGLGNVIAKANEGNTYLKLSMRHG